MTSLKYNADPIYNRKQDKHEEIGSIVNKNK